MTRTMITVQVSVDRTFLNVVPEQSASQRASHDRHVASGAAADQAADAEAAQAGDDRPDTDDDCSAGESP